MALRKAALTIACACLWNCDLFSVRPFDAKPERLRPERDLFSDSALRDFRWIEYVEGTAPDSPQVLRSLNLHLVDHGDALTPYGIRRWVEIQSGDGSSLPVSVVTSLGLDPMRLAPDSNISDPGPSLPFPEYPQPGWRVEMLSGDLRFVRKFLGLDTVDRPEGLVETYAFAESTYWNNDPVASGKYWFGKSGLLRHLSEWPDFGSENSPTLLRREIAIP